MANRLTWRFTFHERFGFMPDPSERTRFLRHVARERGQSVWRGNPAGFNIAGKFYDPNQVADAMMLKMVFVPRSTP